LFFKIKDEVINKPKTINLIIQDHQHHSFSF
jgi:hypothetical protein